MKNRLSKIIAGVVLSLSLVAMPIMLVGCKKEDGSTVNSVLESRNNVVKIGELTFSLMDYKIDTISKEITIVLVVENYSDSDIEIKCNSFVTDFGVTGSNSNSITVQTNSISSYEIAFDCTGYQLGRSERFIFLGNHLIGSLGSFEL